MTNSLRNALLLILRRKSKLVEMNHPATWLEATHLACGAKVIF